MQGSATDVQLFNKTNSARPDNMRLAGHAFGAQEAKKAIVTLGDVVTWIGRTIDDRCEELQDTGANHNDVEAWRSACRANFLAKMRRVLVD